MSNVFESAARASDEVDLACVRIATLVERPRIRADYHRDRAEVMDTLREMNSLISAAYQSYQRTPWPTKQQEEDRAHEARRRAASASGRR